MNFVKHSTNNMVLGAPKDDGTGLDVSALPLTRSNFQGVQSSTSFWLPNEEEISRILNGHPIAITVLGPAFYPLYAGVSDSL